MIRGNYKNSLDRFEYLELALAEANELNISFGNVSSLAKYCAVRMGQSLSRHNYVSAKSGGNEAFDPFAPAPKVNWRALLKSKLYRAAMDRWMAANGKLPAPLQAQRERDLEFQVLKLSNKYARLEKLYDDLLGESIEPGKKLIAAEVDDAGFIIVKILLARFEYDVIVEQGALKERSAARTVFVPERIFKPYLDWLGKDV